MKFNSIIVVALAATTASVQAAKSVDEIIAAVLPKNNSAALKSLFEPPSKLTPKFEKLSQINLESVSPTNKSLTARQSATTGDGSCAPGRPCSNGACCSKNGYCGYSPDFCGSANCISNCDAKAQCGRYAPSGKQKCPLNVCCSQYGAPFHLVVHVQD
jgi:hypothetical protein